MKDIVGTQIEIGQFVRTQNPDNNSSYIPGEVNHHIVLNQLTDASLITYSTDGGVKVLPRNDFDLLKVQVVSEDDMRAEGVDPDELRVLNEGAQAQIKQQNLRSEKPMDDNTVVLDSKGFKIGAGDIVETTSLELKTKRTWSVLGTAIDSEGAGVFLKDVKNGGVILLRPAVINQSLDRLLITQKGPNKEISRGLDNTPPPSALIHG